MISYQLMPHGMVNSSQSNKLLSAYNEHMSMNLNFLEANNITVSKEQEEEGANNL